MRPPMVPSAGKGIDAVNFRSVKESESVDIGAAKARGVGGGGQFGGGDGGEMEEGGIGGVVVGGVDPFEEFNSGGFFLPCLLEF